jgi:hypothetical protein
MFRMRMSAAFAPKLTKSIGVFIFCFPHLTKLDRGVIAQTVPLIPATIFPLQQEKPMLRRWDMCAACTLAAATGAYWLYRKLNRPRVTLEPSAALKSYTTAAASAAPPPSKVQPSMAASAAAPSNSTDAAPFPLGTTAKLTGLMNPRRSSSIKTFDRKMSQVAAFSPLLAHWEIERHHPDELVAPGAFDFESALLIVDISGFTALCTKLDIDVLQRHINTYFGELIDVVSKHDGDVLRFVGDALFCAWSLPCGAEVEGTLALATLAACRCALELHQKCSSYLIPEANERLSMCAPSPPPPSPPPPSPSPTLALCLLRALAHQASRGHLATPSSYP